MNCFTASRRQNFLRVALRANGFGEWLTYLPAGGGPHVRLMATVQPPSEMEAEDKEELAKYELIDVLLSSAPDSLVDGVSLGGIERPTSGDRIQRDGDPAGDTYSYDFLIRSSEYSHRLRFRRRRTVQIGTSQSKR